MLILTFLVISTFAQQHFFARRSDALWHQYQIQKERDIHDVAVDVAKNEPVWYTGHGVGLIWGQESARDLITVIRTEN